MSKQTLKAPEKSSQQEKQNDFPLDKYVFRTCTYGLAGFGVGLAASLFFKHKLPITALFTGAGAGYGMHGLTDDWQSHQKYKSWMNTQTQQRGDDNSQSGRDLDSFNFNQYAQAQKNHEWTRQSKDEFKSSQQKKDENQRQDQSKGSDFKFERQGQKSDQEKADTQRQKRDQKEQDKDSGSKFERKQEGKSEQQGKQQGQQVKRQAKNDKEEPLNPEAQQKKNIAERNYDKPSEKEAPKMGKGHDVYPWSQDRKKREEDALYSDSMQGGGANTDDINRGERTAANPKIPPSQRDWTGGHANKGVTQQQVHRGAPEADKMGKSVRPDTEPNKHPDRGAPQQGNQALANIDLKGQNLQTFESNPLPLGKAGLTHEIQKNYQEGRNRANDPNLDNTRRSIAGIEQDRLGKSFKDGINLAPREKSDTESGVHNYRPVAEKNLKNQVNAVMD